MVGLIRSNVSINSVRESSGLSGALSDVIAKSYIPAKDNTDAPTDVLDISKRAKQFTLGFKSENDGENALNLDDDFLNKEYVDGLKQKSYETLTKQLGDPFEDEEAMREVHYEFSDLMPEYKMNNILEGKAKNSSVVVNELGDMLRQTAKSRPNRGATVEERAEIRETALRSAQYIADTYLKNPNEARDFMSAVYAIYDEDVAREKGYKISYKEDGTEEYMKPYLLQTDKGIVIDGDILFNAYINAYCGEHGISKADFYKDKELSSNVFHEICGEIFSHTAEENKKLTAEAVKKYNLFEKKIDDTIKSVKLNFDASLLNNNLVRLLKAF